MIQIPLNNSFKQEFNIALNGQSYDVYVALNSRSGFYTIDLKQGNTDLVIGVTLASGVDILRQYILNLKNMFIININAPTLDPERENIGDNAALVILTDEELPDATAV